ncbi:MULTISPECIES: DUF2614 family zinc ribbon-containing protein [unclassified Paenibacillus]|uniref:DUF2614 family zinc ribbon-containing protein n=1 Tax=Paenibacillus TaxID=44249 RepID=UPI0006D07079|nr:MULTISPECIES: DUF2614 family zinc ribbon-containing protein [unclassified Paenibacillus]
MRFKSSKVNEFRLWGLLLTMGGMLLMITGLAGIVFEWGKIGRILAATCMVLGGISMLVSMGVYFTAGMMSTSATVLVCPECGKHTKMLGKTDRCMYCKTILTFDPKYAPSENPEETTGTSVSRSETTSST